MQNNFTSLNGSIHSLFNQRFSFKHLAALVASVLVILCAVWLPYALFWQLDGLLSLQQAQILGSCMFYGGIASFVAIAVVTRFRLSKDWSLKRNVGLFSILLLTTLVFSSLLSAPVVAALTPLPSDTGPNNSSAFKFSVPFTEYQWVVAQFRDGTYYAINGSDWNIMTIVEPWQPVAPWAALASNLTALENQVLSSTTSGKILLNEVNHNYSLTVPANVTVVESKNGLVRQFINSANSQGSPYTISVDTVQTGYYLAQDSANRYINEWSSTDAETIISSAIAIGKTVVVSQGNYGNAIIVLPDGINFIIQKDATGITAYPNQTIFTSNITVSNENTDTTINYGADGTVSVSPQYKYSSSVTDWAANQKVAVVESYLQMVRTYQNSMFLFYRAGATDETTAGVVSMRNSTDDGATWGSPRVIYSQTGMDCITGGAGGLTPSGAIEVFFFVFTVPHGLNATMGYIRSEDNGETWSDFNQVLSSAPYSYSYIPYGKFINVPGKGIMQPIYYANYSNGRYGIGAIWSTDDGLTWSDMQTVYPIGDTKYDEWSAVYLGQGKILGVIRSENTSAPLFQVQSDDYGETWSTPTATNIRGNGDSQQASPTLISDGTLVKLYFGGRGNPNFVGTTITYSILSSISEVWSNPLNWASPVVEFRDSSPSYPAACILPDGRVALATANSTNIATGSQIVSRIQAPLGSVQPSRVLVDRQVIASNLDNQYGGIHTCNFTNLDRDFSNQYTLSGMIMNRNTNVNSHVYIYFNDDFNKTNYSSIILNVTGTEVSTTERRTEPVFTYTNKNTETTFELQIFYSENKGLITYTCTSTYTDTSCVPYMMSVSGSYLPVVTDFNSITLVSEATSGFGLNSFFTLESIFPMI